MEKKQIKNQKNMNRIDKQINYAGKRYFASLLTALFILPALFLYNACDDIYDDIKKFSLKEEVYPAKFDTIFASVGFERVEIDLNSAGRVPAKEMKLGKAKKTLILWDEDKESLSIDSVCSWVNITGLNESRLYRFKIFTEDEYGNRSTPLEIAVTPYTEENLKILALTPPRITESTSSALLEWQQRLSSIYYTMFDYRYEYTDRNNRIHSGGGKGDIPSFFVEDVQQGHEVPVNMKFRILPIHEGKSLLDTIEWNTQYVLNISDAAIPAIFLKSPEPLTVIHMTESEFPVIFSWTKVEGVSDYTLKIAPNTAFSPSETVSFDVSDVNEFELDRATIETTLAPFHVKEVPLYWTVISASGLSVRNQTRQIFGQKPRIEGLILDDCESLAGWGGWKGGFVLDENCTQGRYSVSLAAPNVVAFEKNYNPVNAGFTKESGYLAFDFYVSDANLLGPPLNDDTQFEITSAGVSDQQELSWGYGYLNLQTGWNHLELPLRLGQSQGGEIDLTHVNHIRLFSWRFSENPGLIVKVDNIRFISY
jgi:hypothetical protein